MESGRERIERYDRELAAESALAISSRQSNSTEWRIPSAGLWPARRGEFLAMCADYRSKGAKPVDAPLIFGSLAKLLGDHSVRLFSANVRSGADSLDAGWSPVQHGHQIKSQLSKLADAAAWRTISAAAGGLDGIHCRAVRGGGPTQHTVWFLDVEPSVGPVGHRVCDRLWLAVAAQHISADTGPFCVEPAAHELSVDVNCLIEKFFEAATATGGVISGSAEVITGDHRCYNATNFVNGVRFGDAAVNVAHREGGPFLTHVAAYNLFGPAMVRRLGGVKRLQKLAVDFDFRALPGGDEIDWRLGYGPATRVKAVGRSCMAAVFPVNQRLEQEGSFDRDEIQRDLWMKNELARAGLLEHLDTGWQKGYKQRVVEMRKNALLADRDTPSMAAAERKIDWAPYLAHMRKNRPSSIRNGITVDSLPWEAELSPQVVCHEVLSSSGAGAMAIYGKTIEKGIAGLASPVLVGSLMPSRAACHFDERIHGHDGFQEADRYPITQLRRTPKLRQLECPECRGRLFRAWALLEYPDDLDDFRTEPEYAEREEMFTWFYLHAQCVSCQWHDEVASIECA